MVTIAVLIATPSGRRLLAASAERDAAAMAEAELLALAPGALPVPVWVQCVDEGVRGRLSAYLADLQRDLAALPPAARPTAPGKGGARGGAEGGAKRADPGPDRADG